MSLPMPHTGGTPAFPANLTPEQQDALDAPLIALASKSGGDLRKLLFMFFSFLHRRTDFYCVPNRRDAEEGVPLRMGFKEGDAEKLLLAAFRQFPLRRMPRQVAGGRGDGPTPSAGGGATKPKAPPESAPSDPVDGRDSDLAPPASDRGGEAGGDEVGIERSGAAKSAVPSRPDPTGDVRRAVGGRQIPVGNGGATRRYRWTQTLDEVSVVSAVPEGTRGRDLAVTIQPTSLSVRLKAEPAAAAPPILEGELTERVRADESTWSLEGGALLLTLDKAKKMWWETVLVGDDKIDTSLVDSTRKIGSYDEETQGAIRKIMFDQRQERLGLPTSEEILGKKPQIPPLPPGVEYIDKSTFEREGGDKGETPKT